MDSGAAVRAKAISVFRSVIRYWSIGAMRSYNGPESCAWVCGAAPRLKIRVRVRETIAANLFGFIDYLPELASSQSLRFVSHHSGVAHIAGAAVPSDHMPVAIMNTSIGSGFPLNIGSSRSGVSGNGPDT